MATGEQAEQWSEEYIDNQCSICEANKKAKNAHYYCFNCQKYMCTTCLSVHNTFSDKHNVLEVTDDNFQKILTERCEKHPDDVIKYYCREHSALLCNTCGLIDHKKCEDIKLISENADKLNADPKLQVVPDDLLAALEGVNQVINCLDEHVVKVKDNGSAYLSDLEDYATKLMSKIKELKAIGQNDITHSQENIISLTNESRNKCIKIKEILSKYIDDIKRSEKRIAHLFVMKKKGQVLIQEVDALCRESKHVIKNNAFCFRPETHIADHLYAFGSLATEVKLYKSRLVNDITLKIQKDTKECNIHGCCRLGDGTLILADYSNMRLKRVDPFTNKVTDHCIMTRRPVGVCSIGPQELAVASGSGTIQFISAEKGLTPTQTIDLGHRTMYLTFHDGELFTTSTNRLYVHNMAGKMLRNISHDNNGRELFTAISGVAVNESGNQVFVTDLINGLVCVNRDGMCLFRLFNENLGISLAGGVTSDHQGHVMVTGRGTKNVVLVTKEGRVVGEILSEKDTTRSPHCLNYDSDRRRIYVGGNMSHLLGFDLM